MPPPVTQESDSLEPLIRDPSTNPLGISRGDVFLAFKDTSLQALCDAEPAGLPGLVGADTPFDADPVPGDRVDRLNVEAATTCQRRGSLRESRESSLETLFVGELGSRLKPPGRSAVANDERRDDGLALFECPLHRVLGRTFPLAAAKNEGRQ